MNERKPKQYSEREKDFIKQELLNLLEVYQKHESELGKEKEPEELEKAKQSFEAKVNSFGIRQREPDEDFSLYVQRVTWEEAGLPITGFLPLNDDEELTENEKPRLGELLDLLELEEKASALTRQSQQRQESFGKIVATFLDDCDLERATTEIPERPLDLIALKEDQKFADVTLSEESSAEQIEIVRGNYQDRKLVTLVKWWKDIEQPSQSELEKKLDNLTRKQRGHILFCVFHGSILRRIRQFFDDYAALGFKRPNNNDLFGNYISIAINLGLPESEALKENYSLKDLKQLLKAKQNEKIPVDKSGERGKKERETPKIKMWNEEYCPNCKIEGGLEKMSRKAFAKKCKEKDISPKCPKTVKRRIDKGLYWVMPDGQSVPWCQNCKEKAVTGDGDEQPIVKTHINDYKLTQTDQDNVEKWATKVVTCFDERYKDFDLAWLENPDPSPEQNQALEYFTIAALAIRKQMIKDEGHTTFNKAKEIAYGAIKKQRNEGIGQYHISSYHDGSNRPNDR